VSFMAKDKKPQEKKPQEKKQDKPQDKAKKN
jgi:hypothetical protein